MTSRASISFQVDALFADRLALWLNRQEVGICFRGAGWNMDGTYLAGFGVLSASDKFEDLTRFCQEGEDYIFCHLNYDVKNHLESLESSNQDHVGFPLLHAFIPQVVITGNDETVEYLHYPESTPASEVQQIFEEIQAVTLKAEPENFPSAQTRISKETFLGDLAKLQTHIQQGDVYQGNYCQEFFWQDIDVSGARLFNDGFSRNPNPFSAYYRLGQHELISFSPERFLSIEDRLVRSQPMKGTAARGTTDKEDESLKQQLETSEKDRRENVMIVDLVRNDLSHFAEPGSVQVPELYKIATYPRVHQMYSTVTARLKKGVEPMSAILKAFPMGSMTGAPKVSAMKILDGLEHSRRGIYSGTVGFITPTGIHDFNVVIRSLVYNQNARYLSCHAGGGITALSNPLAEYEECLVKIRPLLELVDRAKEAKSEEALPLGE